MTLLLILICVYFIPCIVAGVRSCKAYAGIAVVNLLLGWTFVGWVVALAWAASGEAVQRSAAPGA